MGYVSKHILGLYENVKHEHQWLPTGLDNIDDCECGEIRQSPPSCPVSGCEFVGTGVQLNAHLRRGDENLWGIARKIVDRLFDVAEVPVDKRQAVNDEADKFVYLLLRSQVASGAQPDQGGTDGSL